MVEGKIEKKVIAVSIALIMVATIFVIGAGLLGSSNFVSSYNETRTVAADTTYYLANSDLLSGSMALRNATHTVVPAAANYTVDYTVGTITIAAVPEFTMGTYSIDYQKDKVPDVVQTLVVVVIAIIATIAIVRAFLKSK